MLAQSTSHSNSDRSKPFLIGAEWQPDASQAVKNLFWETGCNFARITGGGYGWASDAHKRAIRELNLHGVKVLLQLGSHYPDSRFFEFKDAYFVDQNGKTGVPSKQSWAVEYDGQAWPQYSYASEHFRSELEKDFSSYLKALGPFNNVEALLLHNEPGLFWLDNRIFDYNADTIAAFRKWLPTQHPSIADLNRCWGTAFDSFATVEPPRDFPTPKTLAAWADWRRANAEVVTDFLTWERGFARRVEPQLPATTNLSGPIDNWYPLRVGDNYRFTRTMDIATIDIYPGSEWSSKSFPGYSMDMTRGAAEGKPVYVAECESYSPTRFPKLSDRQRADRLASDLWTYIGHGANGVLVWTLNGQDEFRLTNGEFNLRLAALRETAATAQMLDLGSFRNPTREVAIVVDSDSFLIPQRGLSARDFASEVDRTIQGYYASLAQAHIAVDIVSAQSIRQAKKVNYRALILPSQAPMDQALASALTRFVGSGGLAIADASLGMSDDWGKALGTCPGFGLDRVFGCRTIAHTQSQRLNVTVSGGDLSLQTTRGIEQREAGTIASFGDQTPAIVSHRYGKGQAIMLAGNAGLPLGETLKSAAPALFASWIRSLAGVLPVAQIDSPGYVDASCLTDLRGNSILVIANPADKSKPIDPLDKVVLKSSTSAPRELSFSLVPAHERSGRWLSGPTTLTDTSWAIPHVDSYALILRARNHGPIIATDSPIEAQPGSMITVYTTVYNPSPSRMRGEVSMGLPTGWVTDSWRTLQIEPLKSTTIAIQLRIGASLGRATVKPVVKEAGLSVSGIPFDILVTR
ncbi:MAG: beta-galactosidase [Fimbriimonas sp.]|nr:beta-galactosidase [Fimbriimonas sp.]